MAVRDERAVVEIILKGTQPNATLKEIEKSARALRAQLNRLPADSKEFEEKTKELANVNRRLNKIREDIKGTGSMFQWLGKEIKAFGLIAVAALGFQWITGQISNIIRGNGELSDSLADVRKTTGMTESEARRLNTTLGQLDTRTPTKELRNIAVAAGQLGIAKNDILRFTAATDKMVVALGDEFEGGATQVTKVMGGLRTIFKDIATDKIDQDLLRIGNAVNVLASSGAATGPVMTDLANRIGGVANNLGFTSAQTLGLSATLEEMKVGTEKGGTAVVKILQRMTTHVAEFANVADMNVKDFANLVNTNLYGAFVKVIEGSQKSGTNATALGAILDSLGVDGAGASEVMSKLGQNMDLLDKRVNLAGSALKNTDSIMNEFRIKNSTLGADMDRLGKNMASWFTNSTIASGLKSIIGWMADLTDKSKKLSQTMEDERRELMRTEAEILTYNIGNENRTKLIQELQEKYPDYLKNIDAETVSHQDLSNAIARVNARLVDKIILQRQDEKINEQAEEQADAAIEAGEARVKVLEDIARIYEKNENNRRRGAPMDLKKELSGLPLEVAAQEILTYENYTKAGFSQWNEDIISLRSNYEKWTQAEIALNEEKLKSRDLDNEKQKLLRALGITMDELTEKEKKAGTGGAYTDSEAAKKHAKEVLEKYKALQKELQQMRVDNSMTNLTEMQKEQARVYAAHEAFKDRIMADEKMTAREREIALSILEEHTLDQLNSIKNKYQAKEIKEAEDHQRKYNELVGNSIANQEADIRAAYETEIEFYKDNAEKKIELEEALQRKLDELRNKRVEDEKKANEKTQASFQEYYSSLTNFANAWQNYELSKRSYDTTELDKKANNDLSREQRLLDKKIINQEEYESRVQEINNDRAKKETELRIQQFKAEQDAALESAIINGAEAVTQIWAKHAANPYLAATLSLMAAGTTAFQIQTITNREPPKFAEGGFTYGPNLYSSSTGQDFIAGEAGREYIISNPMLQNGWIANQVGIMEAMRTGRTFADGGFTGNASGPMPQFSGSNMSGEMMSLLKEQNALLRSLSSGITARLYYDDFQKTMDSIDNARNRSAIQ